MTLPTALIYNLKVSIIRCISTEKYMGFISDAKHKVRVLACICFHVLPLLREKNIKLRFSYVQHVKLDVYDQFVVDDVM